MAEVNDFDSACKQAFEDLKQVHNLFSRLMQDYRHGGRGACSRSKEFDDALIDRNLKKAEGLLNKDGYQVSLLGTFSAGKSILCNGLLEAPGFLPSSQGVCTLAVTEVMGTHGRSNEGVIIKYMTLEGTFRKVFGSDQFKDQLSHRLKDLSPFDETSAKKYVEQAIEAYDQAEDDLLKENATRLRGFIKAIDAFRDRLNTTHTDSIVNKDDYLSAQGKEGDMSGGLGEGHMWLIERVFVTVENAVLARENVKIVDLPGVDAPSAHDKEVTFAAIPDSDAAVLVVGQRGFAMADRELIERIAHLSNDVREKIFVVVNKMDTLNPKELVEFDKAFWKDLKEKVFQMRLNLGKLYFCSAFYEEERLRERLGLLDENRKGQFEAFKHHLQESLKQVQQIGDEGVRERLTPVFVDGGVRKLRQDLYNYLRQDIKRERLREVYQALREVHEKWEWLVEPERSRIQTGQQLRRDRVSQFFHAIANQVDDAVMWFKTGRAPGGKNEPPLNELIAGAVKTQIKEPAAKVISVIVDKLPFEQIKERVSVALPVNIRQEALNILKPQIRQLFKERVLQTIPGAVLGHFSKCLAKSGRFKIENVLEHFSREFPSERYLEYYRNEINFIKRTIDLMTELKVNEILMPMDAIQAQAMPGEPQGFNERQEAQFKEYLKKVFGDLFNAFSDQVVAVAEYYKGLVGQFQTEFRKLMEKIQDEVATKRAYAVDLPDEGGRSDGTMDEKEILQNIADRTDTGGTKLDSFRTSLAPLLGIQT